MRSKKRMTLSIAGFYIILLIASMLSTGNRPSSSFSTSNAVPLKDPAPMPVVLIDIGHQNSHMEGYPYFAGDAEKWSSNLTEWGFEVRFLDNTLSTADLTDVDIFIASFSALDPDNPGSIAYTDAELTALHDWFILGNKSAWIAGDSDYDDDTPMLGSTTNITNALLLALGSNAMVEDASVESEDNFKAEYRVKASVYNMADAIPAQLLSTTKHGGAEFHGPSLVVGYNDTGDLVALESPAAEAYFKARNLYWVIKATNNDTHKSTIVHNTPPTRWSLHGVNAQDNFVMMTAQELGPSNSCKLVVTGEAPWSTYKHMFDDPGELGIPQDQYYIVKEVLHWFATPGYEASCQAHIITPEDGSTTIEPEAIVEGVAKGDSIDSIKVYIDGSLETTLQRSYAKVDLVDDLDLGSGTYNLTIVATSGEGIVSEPDTVVFTLEVEEEADGDDGIPGFELFTIVLALVFSGLILKRRRR